MTKITGLNRHTGGPISDEAQLHQDVADLLSTRKGTRLCLRDYGSDIPALLDAPQNSATAILLSAAAAKAINKWLGARLRITKSSLTFSASGEASLSMTGFRPDLPQQPQISLSTVL